MRKPIIVLSLIFAFAIVSGCISQNSTSKPFKYLGTHETEFLENVMGREDIYEDSYGAKLRILVVNRSSADEAEELIREYKSQDAFKNLSYNPFEEVSIGGHKATQITTYYTKEGRSAPLYSYIWSNGSFVFLVTGEDPVTQEQILAFARWIIASR